MEETKEVVSPDLEQKIIRQVEYYFGDYNLPKDKFLQEQIKLDDGWVPLSTMLNFNRLAALTKDEDAIINALKKSSLKLIEVDDEKKKIRRSVEKPVPEMTENRQKELMARTVYCKGFTKENATLDKLLEFFGQFGSVDNIQMRSYLDKATKEYIFKGSVFVVFSTKEEADEFFKRDSVEYEGVKLIVKMQEEYSIDKKKERDEKRRMQKAKVQQATGKPSQSAGQKSQDDEKESDEDEEEEDKGTAYPKGALIHMKDVPKSTTWEDIKSAVSTVWQKGAKEGEETEITVAYVDYRMGDGEGWIRLGEADTAVTLLQRAKMVASSKKAASAPVEEKVAASAPAEEKVAASAPAEEKVAAEKSGDAKSEVVNGVEKDKEPKEDGDADMKEPDVNAAAGDTKDSGSGDKDDVEVSYIEVCGGLVCIRALQGSEEDAYLEKVKGEREKKFQATGRNRKRGGYGGNRRGRGGRGGKRKNNWEGGPTHKRRR